MCNQRIPIKLRWNSEKGFSLVEIMIAMAIFAIGILSVCTMQVSAISTNGGARKISDVLVMAEDQLENIIALPYISPELDETANPHRIDAGGYTMIWNVSLMDLNGDGNNDAKGIQLVATHQTNQNKSTSLRYIKPQP